MRTLIRRIRDRDQRGSATVFMLGFATVLIVGAGLVVDGGLALNARSRLTDDAEQAARAGANAIDVPSLRDRGQLVVDPSRASAIAAGFLSERGYQNISVSVNGNRVTASAESTADTAILGLIGIGSFTVRGDAVAEPQAGIG